MNDTSTGVRVTITNHNDYVLYMEKTKCDKPNDTYQIKLTRKVKDGIVNTEQFYMTETELSYFARALVC